MVLSLSHLRPIHSPALQTCTVRAIACPAIRPNHSATNHWPWLRENHTAPRVRGRPAARHICSTLPLPSLLGLVFGRSPQERRSGAPAKRARRPITMLRVIAAVPVATLCAAERAIRAHEGFAHSLHHRLSSLTPAFSDTPAPPPENPSAAACLALRRPRLAAVRSVRS